MRPLSLSRPRTHSYCLSVERLEDRLQPGSVVPTFALPGDSATPFEPDDSAAHENAARARQLSADDEEPPAGALRYESAGEVRVVATPAATSVASASPSASVEATQLLVSAASQVAPPATGAALVVQNLHSGVQQVTDTRIELQTLQPQVTQANAVPDFFARPTEFSVVDHFTADALAADDGANDGPSTQATRLWSRYVTGTTGIAVGRAATVDVAGNSYITGTIIDEQAAQAFVAKLNPSGQRVYLTTFQVIDRDFQYDSTQPLGIAVDGVGNAFVTGTARKIAVGDMDGFALKLSSDGSQIVYGHTYGTLVRNDSSNGIAVDSAGQAVITGQAEYRAGENALIFGRLNPAGDGWTLQPRFFAYVGYTDVSGQALTLDSSGQNAYIGGWIRPESGDPNPYAAKINTDSANVVYSITSGPNAGEDGFYAVAVNPAGNSYLAGVLTVEGNSYGYVSRLNAAGTDVDYAVAFDDTFGALGLALDGDNALAAGLASDLSAYVVKIDNTGAGADSYFLQGDSVNVGTGVGFRNGVAVLAGVTGSSDIATEGSTLNGVIDAFAAAIQI